VGPDQKAIVKYLATAFRFVSKKVMKKWSMTQVRVQLVQMINQYSIEKMGSSVFVSI
jgi:hypothetical protein